MLGESDLTHSDLLKGNNQYVGRSLKVNGADFRDAYKRINLHSRHTRGVGKQAAESIRRIVLMRNSVAGLYDIRCTVRQ